MADLVAFHFFSGNSLIHKLDIRFKLIILVFMSIASIHAGIIGLGILFFLLLTAFIHAQLPLRAALIEIRFFAVLLLFIFIVRILSTPGESIFEGWFDFITWQGIESGSVVCWRLFLTVMLGILFVFTSKPMEIKASIEWFLKPVPFIPEKNVAIMISLMIRFIPLILEQSKEISDAQNARCIQNRKNPFYRISTFSIAMIKRTFESVDDLAFAMEARCFSENRTDPEFSSSKMDWILLIFIVLVSVAVIFV